MLLKSDENSQHLAWRRTYIYDNISLNIAENKKSPRKKMWTENQSTHFVFRNFISENLAVHEITWQNIVRLI